MCPNFRETNKTRPTLRSQQTKEIACTFAEVYVQLQGNRNLHMWEFIAYKAPRNAAISYRNLSPLVEAFRAFSMMGMLRAPSVMFRAASGGESRTGRPFVNYPLTDLTLLNSAPEAALNQKHRHAALMPLACLLAS